MNPSLITKIALLAGVVLVLAVPALILLVRRRGRAESGRARSADSDTRLRRPRAIHLEPWPRTHWIPSRTITRRVQAFRGMSFRVIGQYRVREMPGLRLVALAHPSDSLAATVYDHDASHMTCEAVAHYRHGGTLTVTTSPREDLPPRPGHEKLFLPRGTPPKKLCQTLFDHLVSEDLLPIHPENFVRVFEKAWAEEEAWRREQSGPMDAILRDPELDALSTPLFQRIQARDSAGVQDFLALGFSPEGRDPHGRTALMAAVITGEGALVELVLRAGADPNARAPGLPGLPPEDTALAEALVTPLTLAIETGVPEIVTALLAAGANLEGPGDPPLNFAAQEGDVDMVRAIVEAGADVDLADEEGMRPIHYASMYGHAEVVEYLVSAGADLQARAGKRTAITLAAENGATEVAELLELYVRPKTARKARKILEEAVPIGNVRARRLRTAAALGRAPMVRKLLAAGVDPDAPEHDGESGARTTALMLATQGGHVEAMRALIEGGADVNAVDEDGEPVISRTLTTDLMEDVAHQGEALRLLVRYGVDLAPLSDDGRALVDRHAGG